MQSHDKNEAIKNVPMIPLRDLVVFPSTLVPFIIGRSSSIQAMERASGQDKMIFLASQMDASLDNPRPLDIHSMGVIAKIIRVVKMDEKNMKVIVEGRKRARIIEYLSTYPFYQVLAQPARQF
jgi:ATP-dependent Lon protease